MENRKCLAIITALLMFAIALSLPAATTGASQPNVTKIAVENCQYSAGTLWHTENVWSRFENTLSSAMYGDWDNSNTGDNAISGLNDTENIIYAGKDDNDNTGNWDNAEWVLEVPFNENLDNAMLIFDYRTYDNVGALEIHFKCLLENTDGDNILLGSMLHLTENSDWYSFGWADFTEYITTVGTYKLKLRTEMLDNGEADATPNIIVWFDNFVVVTKYSGSSDNITVSGVNFAYTENSRTSAGTLGLPIEENLSVTADNDIDIYFEFDPVATGMTWDNVKVNDSNQSYTTSSENARWTFSATQNQVENIEFLYRLNIAIENWATVQTSSSHQIGTDDNVAYRVSVDVGTDFAIENLYLIVSLPDASSLDNTDNAKVAGSYVETTISGENLTFKIDNVKNENSFTIDYYQNGASQAFNGVASVNGNDRRYTWTFTNPSSSHTYENCKFTTTIAELTYRVLGTEVLTWGGTALTASQYTISGQNVTVDPELSAGNTTFTVEFQRQSTGPIIFPVGAPSAQATTTTPPPAVTTTTPPPSDIVTPEVVLVILIVIVVAAVVAFAKH